MVVVVCPSIHAVVRRLSFSLSWWRRIARCLTSLITRGAHRRNIFLRTITKGVSVRHSHHATRGRVEMVVPDITSLGEHWLGEVGFAQSSRGLRS